MSLSVATTVILFMMTHESLATGSCYFRAREGLFHSSKHHALTGHSFLNQLGTVRTQCAMLCVRHRLCLSFNHNDISGMCQLNDARKEEFPESYTQDNDFSYFDRLVSKAYGSVETTKDAVEPWGGVTVTSESESVTEEEEWQLVFKWVAGTGIKVYDLWTNTTWDSSSEDHGNYRNEALYIAWNNGQMNIKQVKLSLYNDTEVKVELVFNGVDSNILSWFAKERLVSSPWSDLTPTATTNYFSIAGDLFTLQRRFCICMNHGGCDKDRGWLVVVESGSECNWDQSFNSYPVILYRTGNEEVSFAKARSDGTLAMADYLTIHIHTE